VVWKVWSFAATSDVTAMYGVGGTPPERRPLRWRGEAMTVDYPPLALYELAISGRIYRAFDPRFDDTPWLTAAVKLPGLVAEILFLVVLYRLAAREVGAPAARWGALALWLNPALLLDGVTLGYLDPQMAVPLTLAVLAAARERPGAAGALLAVAALTKAQAIFVAPLLLAVVFWRAAGTLAALRTFGLASAATAALIVAPFVARGAWANLVQALGRLAAHDMLSAQGANVWWLFTWALRVRDVWHDWGPWAALTQPVQILGIERAVELGYPNARVVGLVLVGGALLWACVKAREAHTTATAFALAAWCMQAYAVLAAQVHENHLVPAVVLLIPAATLDARYRPVFWLLTAVAALNLYLFCGLWWGYAPLLTRSITVIDASVLVSALNVAAFVWLHVVLRGYRRGSTISTNVSSKLSA
jgi:hypothetical protein